MDRVERRVAGFFALAGFLALFLALAAGFLAGVFLAGFLALRVLTGATICGGGWG